MINLKWIISDIYSLYYSIRQAKDNEIFKKYKNIYLRFNWDTSHFIWSIRWVYGYGKY